MRKKIFKLPAVALVISTLICGCQKEPESSTNGDIRHAKDTVENEVAGIVGESQTGTSIGMQDMDCVIGTEDNMIRIQVQMPEIPQNVYCMVLKENETLTKELLVDFLESDLGNVSDLSEEAQREAHQSEIDNEKSEERVLYSVFGDGIMYKLSDGQKTASFSYGTSAYYQDEALYKKCIVTYKSVKVKENVLNETDHADTYQEAEELLLGKLSKIGVTEVYVYKITQYKSESTTFYEIGFTPSYDGMGLVHELGDITLGEVFPLGSAWICEDDIASLNMEYCLGKVETKETQETLLSWEQVKKILEVDINNGKINGSSKAVLTEAEFLYYPVFKKKENKLELVPVWHFYIPMSVWTENEELAEQFIINDAAWSICVNAVSGEIVRCE